MVALELQRWPLMPKPTPPTTTPFHRTDENHHGFPADVKDSVLETVTQITAKSVSVAWVGEAPPSSGPKAVRPRGWYLALGQPSPPSLLVRASYVRLGAGPGSNQRRIAMPSKIPPDILRRSYQSVSLSKSPNNFLRSEMKGKKNEYNKVPKKLLFY